MRKGKRLRRALSSDDEDQTYVSFLLYKGMESDKRGEEGRIFLQ